MNDGRYRPDIMTMHKPVHVEHIEIGTSADDDSKCYIVSDSPLGWTTRKVTYPWMRQVKTRIMWSDLMRG